MSRFRRFLLLAAIGLIAELLGGCVYLRLLELKLQLAHFDENFAVDASDGLTLTFRHPVLLDQDVEGFFHWIPDVRRRLGTAEKWHFAWIKDAVATDGARPPTVITMDLYFANHTLVRMHAPENFFAATFPKNLALAALRSLGHASVDKSRRAASSTIGGTALATAAADKYLTEAGLAAALGAPVKATSSGKDEIWQYRFSPVSSRQRFGDNGIVDVTFTIDTATRRVRLMKGKTVFGQVVFDTTQVGPGTTGSVRSRL